MSGVRVILLFTCHVMFMAKIDVAYTKCTSNFNCSNNAVRKVCCAKAAEIQSSTSGCFEKSCHGAYCTSDGDCGGPSECCSSYFKKCTLYCPRCNSKLDCGPNLYCCKRWNKLNVCRRNCIGEICRNNSDCAVKEYCLSSGTCWSSGLHCRYSRECKGNGECCKSSKCVTSNCTCNWSSDCGWRQYCCKGNRTNSCSTSCYSGAYCSRNADCPRSQTCNLNKMKCEITSPSDMFYKVITVILYILLAAVLLGVIYGLHKLREFFRSCTTSE